MNWKILETEKPFVFEEGEWDGKRSDYLLLCDSDDNFIVGRMYKGFIDGTDFIDFYDENDFEIDNVKYWCKIENPY